MSTPGQDHPDYLPPFPTTWPDTPEEARKVIAAMQPCRNWRTVTIVVTAAVLLIALLAAFAPDILGLVLFIAAIAVGVGGVRRRR